MGEYATHNGQQIKIGTCEDCYYLRADQRDLIDGYDFDADVFRFRFPFPDEDTIEPGCFEDHDRGVRIPSTWKLPTDFADHGSVQFTARPGYVLSIPCPEGAPEREDGLTTYVGEQRVGRNGFHGYPVVKQQRELNGKLVTVVACGACGSKWRLDLSHAAEVAEAFLDEAERMEWQRGGGQDFAHSADTRAFYREMAKRIMAGYGVLDEGVVPVTTS